MQTKLTLRLDDELIRQAKAYAERDGRSVSELVASYFRRLTTTVTEVPAHIPSSFFGVAAPPAGARAPQIEDYREHLERKHR